MYYEKFLNNFIPVVYRLHVEIGKSRTFNLVFGIYCMNLSIALTLSPDWSFRWRQWYVFILILLLFPWFVKCGYKETCISQHLIPSPITIYSACQFRSLISLITAYYTFIHFIWCIHFSSHSLVPHHELKQKNLNISCLDKFTCRIVFVCHNNIFPIIFQILK